MQPLLGILILKIAAVASGWQNQLLNDSDAKFQDFRESSGEPISYCVRGFAHGAEVFSRQLFKEVAKIDRKNVAIAPFGVALSMGMAASGVHGDSDTIISDALGLHRYEMQRRAAVQAVIDGLNAHGPMQLQVANCVYNSSKIALTQSYVASTKRAFRAPILSADFDESVQASKVINEFVKNKTHGRIDGIVNADNLDETTASVTVNNLYLKGKWVKKFNPSSSSGMKFHLENGETKLVPSIRGKHMVRFGEYPEMNASFIELQLESNDTVNDASMFILLPNEIDDLDNLEENYDQIVVRKLRERGHFEMIDIELPKLQLGSKIQLPEPLTKLNLGNLFDPSSANFQAMTRSSRLFIEHLVHKTFLEINEEGTEAAATIGKVIRTTETDFDPRPIIHKPDESQGEILTINEAGEEHIIPIRIAPEWVFLRRISHAGSEADASTENKKKFNADRPFCFLIATTNNEPEILFGGRFTGLE